MNKSLNHVLAVVVLVSVFGLGILFGRSNPSGETTQAEEASQKQGYSNYLAFVGNIQIPESGPFSAIRQDDYSWRVELKYGDRDVVWRTVSILWMSDSFGAKIKSGSYAVDLVGKAGMASTEIALLDEEDAVLATFEVDGLMLVQNEGVNKLAALTDTEVDQWLKRKID